MKSPVVLLAASLSLVSAIKGKVDTIHNSNYNPHGPSLYLNALLKYNLEPGHRSSLPLEYLVPHVQYLKNNRRRRRAANATATGFSSEEQEVENIFYLNPVTIGEGNTAQTFNLQFDTGSPDLWVFSDALPPNEAGNNNHTLYKAGQTPTSKQVPLETFAEQFGDGSGAAGPVYLDTVDLGGIIIPNAVVGAANDTTAAFTDNPGDGLVGLSLLEGQTQPQSLPTTVNILANNSDLELPLFTALLTRSTETPGFFTFGYINDSVVPDKNISFTPILQNSDPDAGAGLWAFTSEWTENESNGRTTSQPPTPGPRPLSSITTPRHSYTKRFQEPYSVIRRKDTSSPRQLANFRNSRFRLGNRDTEITLQSNDDFNIGPAVEEGYLFGSIQAGGPGGLDSFDIFGVPWLNNLYAVFDMGTTGPGIFRFGVVQRPPENNL
jgi:Eukaryotic aspartyl protease